MIHGKTDPVAPIQHIRALVERFPDLTLQELNGGHQLSLVYPHFVNRLIAARAQPGGWHGR